MPTLPQLLPLPEAAKKLGLSLADLQARVETGTITAGILPTGKIVVSENELISQKNAPPGEDINAQLRVIKREAFAHLKGQEITVTEAAKKYSIPGTTIRDWINSKYILIINPGGYPMKLDESNIAYCVAIHNVRKMIGIRFGVPLLDDNGSPYLLKHPELSLYRRRRRHSQRRR